MPLDGSRPPHQNRKSGQFVEQRLGVFQIGRVKALREPVVDRRQKLARLIILVFVAPLYSYQ